MLLFKITETLIIHVISPNSLAVIDYVAFESTCNYIF